MFSQVDIDNAMEKLEFVLLTPLSEYGQRVSIADASKIWETNPDFTFQTVFRLAGNETDIASALEQQGFNAEQIAEVISTGIKMSNFQESQEYVNEVTLYNHMLQPVPVAPTLNIQNPVGTAKSPPTNVMSTKATSILSKITTLEDGKVFDATALKPNGTGGRTIPTPDFKRSKKVGSPNIPIISSDIEHYIMAVSMLPGGPERYAPDIEYVRNKISAPKDANVKLPPLVDYFSSMVTTPPATNPTTLGTTLLKPITKLPKAKPKAKSKRTLSSSDESDESSSDDDSDDSDEDDSDDDSGTDESSDQDDDDDSSEQSDDDGPSLPQQVNKFPPPKFPPLKFPPPIIPGSSVLRTTPVTLTFAPIPKVSGPILPAPRSAKVSPTIVPIAKVPSPVLPAPRAPLHVLPVAKVPSPSISVARVPLPVLSVAKLPFPAVSIAKVASPVVSVAKVPSPIIPLLPVARVPSPAVSVARVPYPTVARVPSPKIPLLPVARVASPSVSVARVPSPKIPVLSATEESENTDRELIIHVGGIDS